MREALPRGAGLIAAALLGLGAAMASPADAASPDNSPPPVPPTPPALPAASPEPRALNASVVISGRSNCPRPEAVWNELVTLVPRERLDARLRAAPAGKAPLVEIIDLGVPYRIVAAGQVREYRDESRDCAYRARIAAVFVALAIDPAQLAPQPAPPAPASASAAPAPRDDQLSPRARLDLGATVVGGLGPDDHVGQLGAELRWSAGRRRVGPEVGVTALLPVDNTVGGVRLRQWRLPVDAGVRARSAGPRFERYGELAVSAALLSERALDLATARSKTGVELGVRVAAGMHASRGRFAPFAALSGELVPVPPAIFALPAGTVGHTPVFWIGATAGVSLGWL